MKIVKVLLIVFALINITSLKELAEQDLQTQPNCRVCQRVVYELKFDRMADCGTKPCKNTCHKILQAWNNPNSIFADFQNDVIGKCDICFRAGYCSLTECDWDKANELKIVNSIVENSLFRGKIDKETGKTFIVNNNKKHLTPNSIKKMEKNVKQSLKSSMVAQNAQIAAQQVGDIVNNYVNQASSKQNDKVVKRNVVYKNFILQANTISEATEKEIAELKALLEDYAKMKDFKTVSPVADKKKNERERTGLKKKMKAILYKVKVSVYKNVKLVEYTLKNVLASHKKAITYKQTILKKNATTLNSKQKKHLDTLETEINSLTNFKKTLEEIKTKFVSKLQILKSFAFKLK
jgi:hypothetical protein